MTEVFIDWRHINTVTALQNVQNERNYSAIRATSVFVTRSYTRAKTDFRHVWETKFAQS